MATLTSFEDIIAWQKARVLAHGIYQFTKTGDFARDFKLRDQINAAAGSIMDNIAEGFERSGSSEFIQFLAIAKGSAGEVRSQLSRALDRGYITTENFDDLAGQTREVSKLLAGFIDYLKASAIRGIKFRDRTPKPGTNPNR